LSLQGNGALTLNNGVINFKGTLLNFGGPITGGGGTTTIKVCGDSSQTINGFGIAGNGRLPKVEINKPSGTLTLNSIISCANNWTYIQGDVNPGTSLLYFAAAATLDAQGTSSTMALNDITAAANLTLAGNVVVNGNLRTTGSAQVIGGAYTIDLKGNWQNESSAAYSYGTSTINLCGSNNQTITRTNAANENFYKLCINKPSGKVLMNRSSNVYNQLILTKGIVSDSTTKYLIVRDNATLSGGSDSSYVEGLMRKVGNDAFTFPLGGSSLVGGISKTLYHPLSITAPTSTTDEFSAEYFPVEQLQGTAMDSTLESISSCEYWRLVRTVGSSVIKAGLGWNENCTNSDSPSETVVAYWNNNQWNNAGNSTWTSNGISGNVTGVQNILGEYLTTGRVHSGAYITVEEEESDNYYTIANGNLRFKYEEEYNDTDGKINFKLYNSENGEVLKTENSYPVNSVKVKKGINYYSLNISDLSVGYYVIEITNEKNEAKIFKIEKL
jgi:hypothetical protein